MDEEEIKQLGGFKSYRKNDDENEKVYLNFTSEESCDYITRKAAICKNENIRIFPYIPPQLFKRFSDLSLLTFKARKGDERLKTMIKLGTNDLILKTKLKNNTDWEIEENLEVFGKLSNIDLSIKWPTVQVKDISSPPQGRQRKNVHKFSSSSNEESNSPLHKKAKNNDDDTSEDEENRKKVSDFVKKLEAKNAKKTRYSQTKINFTKATDKGNTK